MVCFFVSDNGGQCGFTSGTSCGGYGNQKRKLVKNVKNALHFGKRLLRSCDACPHCFGTVHGGTAAKGNQSLAMLI